MFLFQIIQFSINTVSKSKVVPFQTVQFIVSTEFNSIWPIDSTWSGATTLGQSGSGSDANEGVLRIPQSCSITGALPSDYFVSYPGYSFGRGVLPLRREEVRVFYSPDWANYWEAFFSPHNLFEYFYPLIRSNRYEHRVRVGLYVNKGVLHTQLKPHNPKQFCDISGHSFWGAVLPLFKEYSWRHHSLTDMVVNCQSSSMMWNNSRN